MTNDTIAKLRREYTQRGLLERDILPDPFAQFERWFHEAVDAGLLDPNAMTLATASGAGDPLARIVLLKSFDQRGFTFYTNYESRKGHDLQENPRATLLFYWAELERQVRIEGSAEKLPPADSEAYFKTRPFESQIGAWVSSQSNVIVNREWLDDKFGELKMRFEGKTVPIPPHWGGYRVAPVQIEFWQGRPNRLHDRILYRKRGHDWTTERLAP